MKDGFYWVRTHGMTEWMIAQKRGEMWGFIGSYNRLVDEAIRDHFVIGAYIGDEAGWTWETIEQWNERHRGLDIANAVGFYWAAWDDIFNVEFVVFSNLQWREGDGVHEVREPKYVMRISRPVHPEWLQPVANDKPDEG